MQVDVAEMGTCTRARGQESEREGARCRDGSSPSDGQRSTSDPACADSTHRSTNLSSNSSSCLPLASGRRDRSGADVGQERLDGRAVC